MRRIIHTRGRSIMQDVVNLQGAIGAINRTWHDFRESIAQGKFTYDDVDSALDTVFFRQFTDMFSHDGVRQMFQKDFRDIRKYEFKRGVKEKLPTKQERFIPQGHFMKMITVLAPLALSGSIYQWGRAPKKELMALLLLNYAV